MEDSITVYSSATCPKCKMLKLELKSRGIPFEDCQDEELMIKKGYIHPPVVVINGEEYDFKSAVAWLKGRK